MLEKTEFELNFFSEIHSRTVENLSGYIQIKLSEQAVPDIIEPFVQEKLESIVDRRTCTIDNHLKTVINKGHNPFNLDVEKRTGIHMAPQPQFDLKVVDEYYKRLYAVYEIKSLLNQNVIPINNICIDIQRLAIVKSFYPEVKCIFIFPGLIPRHKEYFGNRGLQLPHPYNIAGNKNYNKKGRPFGTRIPNNIVNNDYSRVLAAEKKYEIKIRLSQILKGQRHYLLTYEIDV